MRLLVIGSGGREHALVWKLAQSPHGTQMWCAPGNAGIAEERLAKNQSPVECVAIGAEDLPKLLAFADRKSTRLNSSHLVISYAVFCLKKKTTINLQTHYY